MVQRLSFPVSIYQDGIDRMIRTIHSCFRLRVVVASSFDARKILDFND